MICRSVHSFQSAAVRSAASLPQSDDHFSDPSLCLYILSPGGYPIILDHVSGRIAYASIFGIRAISLYFYILPPGGQPIILDQICKYVLCILCVYYVVLWCIVERLCIRYRLLFTSTGSRLFVMILCKLIWGSDYNFTNYTFIKETCVLLERKLCQGNEIQGLFGFFLNYGRWISSQIPIW